MSRERTQFRCRDCGSVAARWVGRCGGCGEWNTLDQEIRPAGPVSATGSPRSSGVPVALATLAGDDRLQPRPTGLRELDRVLGGGLVPSSVTLIAGEPGIGKSTLLLQMLGAMARGGRRALLVSAEESPAQVGLRAARLGIGDDGLWVAGDHDLASIRTGVAGLAPDVLVVDSIQTISDPDLGAPAGSVASVRACASALADDAKSGGPAVVLVGHVTKDGSIAGPRVLEHLVDTVLSFEGDRHHAVRVLRAVKHRFGPVGELGMWEMTAGGLTEVPDGASFLLADRRPGTPGSVVFAGMEGRRPLLAEIQALVAPPAGGAPRRSASGYDSGRLGQLVAVLHRWAGLELHRHDVYVSAVGGLRLADPGVDLAVAVAIASAATGRVVPEDLVVLGEVGLGGELRQVAETPRRLAEAARLGFTRAVTPPGSGPFAGIETLGPSTLGEALDVVLAARPVERPKLRVLSGAGAAVPYSWPDAEEPAFTPFEDFRRENVT
jgi:DNA repair protein RadA/Sms